ncbi:MAG: hypothetical protein IKK69_05445 [Firmicutes bacterium]|nr:hypothetical protein [Bacillota bacterium]
MNKMLRPQIKNILRMDAVAVLIFIIHLIFFEIISNQGQYLENKAHEIIPEYNIINVTKWIIVGLMLVVRQIYRLHLYRSRGGIGGSENEFYLAMGILNAGAIVFALIKAPKLFAFLSIAISHVALFKTIMVVVAYIVPLVILLALVVLVVMWFAGERLK